MARKKSTTRSSTKPPKERGHGTIPQTVEGMDDDRRAALTFTHKKTYEARLAGKKKADADLKNACKVIKADLGDDGLADIKDLIALDAEGGEKKLSERLQRIVRVARWGNVEIQLDMFKPSERGRAFEMGKAAGLRGDPAKPPFGAGTADYNDWLMGHNEGNAALARSGIKAPAPTSSKPASESAPAPRSEFKQGLADIERAGQDIIRGRVGGDQPSTAQVSTT